jgi:CDP-diacylglycerol--serine O-phosphatidyltransferase
MLKAGRLVSKARVDRPRMRRGAYLLPSLLTLGNLFCGYACIVFTLRQNFEQAAALIGIAVVLDMLDGRVARMTGTSSAFGVEFDSLADVVSFGLAPAVLSFAWGLHEFGQAGWAAGFLFVAAAAIRLARFNIQTSAPGTDKRFFVGMPSPAAAGVPAATVYAYPYGLLGWKYAALALPMVLVPAFLMVSTIRYRSFKSFDLGTRRSYRGLLLMALVIAAIATHPQITLVVVAYGYLASGLIGWAWGRLRSGRPLDPAPAPEPGPGSGPDATIVPATEPPGVTLD